jgi:hypothetical protein
MRLVVVLLTLGLASTANAQYFSPTSTSGGESSGRWHTPPTNRLLFGINAEVGTATSVEGTNHSVKGGGFGFDVAFYLPLSYVQPFFRGNIDANIASHEEVCRPSAFDPNTLECERTGDSSRVLGGAQLGLRVAIPKGGEPGPLAVAVGGQYLIQGIYTRNSDAGDDNEVLPFAQIDYAGGDFLVSGGAGFGGYFMLEYARPASISIFDTLVLRLERWGWDREESVVRGFHFHLLIGTEN